MGVTYSHHKETSYMIPQNGIYKPNQGNRIITTNTRYVCVGINYTHTSSKLDGCIKDAQVMEDFIVQRKKGCIGLFLRDDVEVTSPLYPCRDNILRALRWCMSSSSVEEFMDGTTQEFKPMAANTLCFITYSGHGSQVRDDNGDEQDGLDEVICPVGKDGNFDTYIKDDTIGDVLYRGCRKDCNIVIITDSCHSGSNSDLRFTIQGRSFKENRTYPVFAGPVFHIAGCRDSQYSYEGSVDGGTGGFLTHSFIKTMNDSSMPGLYALITQIRGQLKKHMPANYQLPQLSVGHQTSAYSKFPL